MKKLLSLALCAAFLLSFLAPCALAAGSVFTVRTTGDWEALAEACVLDRWSEEKEVVLAGDLDFTGLEFTPIPLFSGHFDGNGHTIRGIDLEKDASTVGVFRKGSGSWLGTGSWRPWWRTPRRPLSWRCCGGRAGRCGRRKTTCSPASG